MWRVPARWLLAIRAFLVRAARMRYSHGDDRVLYAPGQLWLDRDHVMGRSCGYLPHVGMVTIIMNDYVYLKYALIGFLGLLVLTRKE